MRVMKNYNEAEAALFEHVGFKPDWVVCPIDYCTDQIWYVDEESKTVVRADSEEQINSDGDYYEDELYTQRFYDKWVYRGETYTMIFCKPGVDGMKWFRVFDNSKEVQSFGE